MGAPALLDGQSLSVLARINALIHWVRNHVNGGGVPSDGGTTQASGTNTAPNIDIDTTAISSAFAGGSAYSSVGAGTDIDSDAGDQVAWGATSGVASWAAIVLLGDGTFVVVMGDVAATANAVVASLADIEDFVGTDEFAIVADMLFTRTGDTTITLGTPSYARRAISGYADALAVTEAEFRATE